MKSQKKPQNCIAKGQNGTTQTYVAYDEGTKLVSIMTASFCRIFPHDDSPNGKMVHISGAYTHPDYRQQGHASTILNAIERDAEEYGADYICLDSTMDEFYRKKGFIHAPSNESRLWKPLTKKHVQAC